MTETKTTVFTPTADRLLIKPDAEQERTAGGIIVPDQHKTRPRRGTVVAAGPGQLVAGAHEAYRLGMPCAAGDRVLYGKHAGQDVTVNGENLLVMRADEVLGVETEAAPALADVWDPGLSRAGRPALAGVDLGVRCPLTVPEYRGSEFDVAQVPCTLAYGHEGGCR